MRVEPGWPRAPTGVTQRIISEVAGIRSVSGLGMTSGTWPYILLLTCDRQSCEGVCARSVLDDLGNALGLNAPHCAQVDSTTFLSDCKVQRVGRDRSLAILRMLL